MGIKLSSFNFSHHSDNFKSLININQNSLYDKHSHKLLINLGKIIINNSDIPPKTANFA